MPLRNSLLLLMFKAAVKLLVSSVLKFSPDLLLIFPGVSFFQKELFQIALWVNDYDLVFDSCLPVFKLRIHVLSDYLLFCET